MKRGREGRWGEAEKLTEQVIKFQKITYRVDHPYTLYSVDDLAIIYRKQDRVEKAEELEVYYKTKLRANHPEVFRAKAYRRLVDELSVDKGSS